MKKLCLFALAAMVMLSCAEKKITANIVGTWSDVDKKTSVASMDAMTFNEDGRYVSAGKIIMSNNFSIETGEYGRYEIRGDTLVFHCYEQKLHKSRLSGSTYHGIIHELSDTILEYQVRDIVKRYKRYEDRKTD